MSRERKHGPSETDKPVDSGAFLNLRLVVAKLVMAKHVDAGNSDYIALLCGVSVKVKRVKHCGS